MKFAKSFSAIIFSISILHFPCVVHASERNPNEGQFRHLLQNYIVVDDYSAQLVNLNGSVTNTSTACSQHSSCSTGQYCTAEGHCGFCKGEDGCCENEDTFDGGECPLTCNCSSTCTDRNWCKEECGHMDECEDNIWSYYDCPSSRDDCDSDANCYCRVVGIGSATIVLLIVCGFILLYITWWCIYANVNELFGQVVDRQDYQSRKRIVSGGKHVSYGALQEEDKDLRTNSFTPTPRNYYSPRPGVYISNSHRSNEVDNRDEERPLSLFPPGSSIPMTAMRTPASTSSSSSHHLPVNVPTPTPSATGPTPSQVSVSSPAAEIASESRTALPELDVPLPITNTSNTGGGHDQETQPSAVP